MLVIIQIVFFKEASLDAVVAQLLGLDHQATFLVRDGAHGLEAIGGLGCFRTSADLAPAAVPAVLATPRGGDAGVCSVRLEEVLDAVVRCAVLGEWFASACPCLDHCLR